jgi:uncharacterized protein (TIGR01777 family)
MIVTSSIDDFNLQPMFRASAKKNLAERDFEMKLVMAGATGFIGSMLVERLAADHDLTLLTRRRAQADAASRNVEWVEWQPGSAGRWEQMLDGADGVINLAGEPIAGKRWNAKQKERIVSSRINTTRALVTAIAKAKNKPKFLVNASAVGYYGHRGDELLTEESGPGNDFLADVCAAWESEARKAEPSGVRVALVRTGIVLGKGQELWRKWLPLLSFLSAVP